VLADGRSAAAWFGPALNRAGALSMGVQERRRIRRGPNDRRSDA